MRYPPLTLRTLGSVWLGTCLIVLGSAAHAASTDAPPSSSDSARSSGGQFVFGTTTYLETRQMVPTVSHSLENAPEDALALSKAGKVNDLDQVRTLLLKHGFTEEQLKGLDIEIRSVTSPRDAASGLATGKRQAQATPGDNAGGDAPPASKVKVTISVSIKPPKLVITITW